MKDWINKPANFNRIEFWGVTTIFVFLVFFHISDALRYGSSPDTRDAYGVVKDPFNYFFISNLIRYTVLYVTFLLLNFIIVPGLLKKKVIFLNVLFVLLIYLAAGAVFGVTNTYLKYAFDGVHEDPATHNRIFQNSFLYAAWLMLLFGFYSVIKYTGLYLLSRSEAIQARYRIVTPGGLVAFVLWMIGLFFLVIGNAHRIMIAFWAVLIPFGILLYWYSFHTLIPQSLPKKKPFRAFLWKTILLLLITLLPVSILGLLLTQEEEGSIILPSFNFAFQLLITMPLSWILFKRYMQGNAEISALKTELGQSHANFDFLRSQINPHFLFNALNTIYGTALQEKAERTSEGIEKLGDMMRFMLQENMQEKIALAREIDYLNNYISLQKLRTDPNPAVRIETAIEQPVHTVQIAPMLLIPFVENAFKHGISFREPSHIKITLEVKGHSVYFDVSNSKHAKQESDPEKNKSGIGLNNVKQRLQLLYPGKHELIIRETGKDFFVHLTIRLT